MSLLISVGKPIWHKRALIINHASIVAQNSENRARIDSAKAVAVKNRESKADSVLEKRKVANEKSLDSLERESKTLKKGLKKIHIQKMKIDLAAEEARFLVAKTCLEQNMRAIKADGKGTMGLHEKKVLNHQLNIDLYQESLRHFQNYFVIKGHADVVGRNDNEESDSEEDD